MWIEYHIKDKCGDNSGIFDTLSIETINKINKGIELEISFNSGQIIVFQFSDAIACDSLFFMLKKALIGIPSGIDGIGIIEPISSESLLQGIKAGNK